MAKSVLGIIGGSGIYDLPELENSRWISVESPWGEPSDQLRIGEINGLKVVFLPRHGRGHVHSPSDINYRANIDVLKREGVTDLVSVSACGSLEEQYAPGSFVLVEQFIDRTFARANSFFGKGCVAHVSMATPVSPSLVDLVEQAIKSEGVPYHRGATYLAMEGPQFSTKIESDLYRFWNCGVIGMTNMPEARLAREAEICYAPVAMVTDYDSWHPEHGEVDINSILKVLKDNEGNARRFIATLARNFPEEHPICPNGSDKSLEHAILTKSEHFDSDLIRKLDAVAGRVLNR